MAVRGIAAPQPPAESYEPIWCAWGYEREFSLERVRGTLPKVRELGLDWATSSAAGTARSCGTCG